MKVLNYLYPMDNPNQLKVFQGSNSKIRGINFKRNSDVACYIKKNLNDFSQNYGIYVLNINTEDDFSLYIGQSTNGFNRIDGHNEKNWTEGLLLITENNSWDKTVIDYLEYKLINIFNESKYTLINKDLRIKEPVLDIFQQAKMKDLVDEILFLLASNGIDTAPSTTITKNQKIYQASNGSNAKLIYNNGEFILLKDSEVKRPIESSKEWQSDAFFRNGNEKIDKLLESGKIIERDDKYIVTSDIAFKSPSGAGQFVSGYSVNGYHFWKGLDEIRQGELDE